MGEYFSVSSHCLDTTRGVPAASLQLSLEKFNSEQKSWEVLGKYTTNEDGRVPKPEFPENLTPGTYQVTFHVAEYFESHGITEYFFPFIPVVFKTKPNQHFHIPLLLSPFGYSTYRGS